MIAIAEQEQIKPGLYPGLPMLDYQRAPGLNHSKIKLFNKTPAHAHYALTSPPAESDAFSEGDFIHACLLEPSRLATDFAVAPRIDKRTSAGKSEWAAFQAENATKTILESEQYNECKAIADAVWLNPTARKLLEGQGSNELGAFWNMDGFGLCKARIDRFTTFEGWPTVLDIKTTGWGADRSSFSKDIAKFEYHQQAAWYLDGLNALAPLRRRFVFLAVEKQPPYCCAAYWLEDDAVDEGRKQYRRGLELYRKCKESGTWPGYSLACEGISIPAWKFSGGTMDN